MDDRVARIAERQRQVSNDAREYLIKHWFHGDEDNADVFLMELWLAGFMVVPVSQNDSGH